MLSDKKIYVSRPEGQMTNKLLQFQTINCMKRQKTKDRQRDKQKDRKTERQKNRKTEKQKNKKTEKRVDRLLSVWIND